MEVGEDLNKDGVDLNGVAKEDTEDTKRTVDTEDMETTVVGAVKVDMAEAMEVMEDRLEVKHQEVGQLVAASTVGGVVPKEEDLVHARTNLGRVINLFVWY